MTQDKDQRDVLQQWIDDNGWSVTWVAQKVGWTREMLSYVLHKKRPMSPKLARDLREKLGIPVEGQPRQKKLEAM